MISILCPTRGRLDRAKEMAKSAIQTAAGDVEILFGIDMDDYSYVGKVPSYATAFYMPPGKSVGWIWNRLALWCRGDTLMMGNDDLIFRTHGWDTLIPKYEDEIFVAWFNDGSKRAAERCAFPIVSRRWYKTLGYFTPECFQFFYHDTWVHDVGKRVGRTHYISEGLVEHNHFTFGKSEKDETYLRHRRGGEKNRLDTKIFHESWEKREADAAKLLALIT